MPDEQQLKRDYNRQQLGARRDQRSAKMDSMLDRQWQRGPVFSNKARSLLQKDENVVNKGRNIEKSAKRIGKGAAQLAAGNKVAGAVNIARGAKKLAGEFFAGGFLSLGVFWFFMLLLAVAKDSFDIMFVELVWWIDWIVDIIVGGMLLLYLAIHGARKSRIIKFASLILEIMPFTGLMPWWTISVIYVGIMKENKR